MSQAMTIFQNPGAMQTLQQMAHDAIAGGKPYLKFTKAGHWEWGVEENRVADSDRFAVNTASIQLGFIAWHNNIATERMAYITEPQGIVESELPEVETDLDTQGKPRGWQQQRGVDLRQLNGGQAEMTFKTSSQGGLEAIARLVQAIVNQAQTNPAEPVAIVKLTESSYKHPKYGKIYKPVFEVVDWMSMEALTGGEPKKALV